nr:arginine/serine-rich coiled-coil protein 2-like isoform X1 [Coffea arabica]
MEPRSSPQERVDSATATFRKPSTDAGNRIYRRRSPVGGSSASEGSPTHERNSTPIQMSKDSERGADERRRKDEGRDTERHSGRSHYGRSGDSYSHSDRRSSRSSRGYHRHDDYHRRDKYVDGDDRDYSRSARSGRDSRSNTYSDYSRREGEHRSRDHARDDDRYSGDKLDGLGDRSRGKEREKDSSFEYERHREKISSSDRAGSGRRRSNNDDIKHGERDRCTDDKVSTDEKLDHQRSSGDYRSDRGPSYEESRTYKNDSSSRRDSSGHRLREASRGDVKSLDSEKYAREEKNYDDRERYKERHQKESGDKSEDGNGHFGKDQESSAKKQKLINMDESNSNVAEADEKNSSSLKQAQEFTGTGSAEQACLTDSDIDAAKVAAMKAAELVNRNLVGTGFMSADQKKKLLWGNKKTAVADESANHWDTTIFGDRERQEKFHKLMSLRLHWYLWPIVGCEGRNESGPQTRRRSCREAEGAAPDGFREAIYCWITSKGWSHRWSRSLKTHWMHLLVYEIVFGRILLYNLRSIKFIDIALACRIRDLWLKLRLLDIQISHLCPGSPSFIGSSTGAWLV